MSTHEERQLGLLEIIKKQDKELNKLRKDLDNAKLANAEFKKLYKPCFMCKFISNQTKHGKSDFFKLANQYRREGQLFELFREINSTLKQLNLSFEIIRIVENSENDLFKFSVSKSSLQACSSNSVEMVLFWKDKLLIAYEAYRSFCFHLQLDLPSIHSIRLYRCFLNSTFSITKLNDYSYFVDIKLLMHQKIKSFLHSCSNYFLQIRTASIRLMIQKILSQLNFRLMALSVVI
jgi:hypothetical protein